MVKLKCTYCGKEINKPPCLIRQNNFCNIKCYHLYTRQKDIIYYENNYAYILLSKNNLIKKVIFDIEDIEKVQEYKWHLHYQRKSNRYDVCANSFGSHKNRKYINMPRYIMNCPNDKVIDHINHNTLDNRKCNLKICTHFENNLNKTNNTSGCVGVYKNKNKWRVIFREKFIGNFDTFEKAVQVRKMYELNYLSQLQNNF